MRAQSDRLLKSKGVVELDDNFLLFSRRFGHRHYGINKPYRRAKLGIVFMFARRFLSCSERDVCFTIAYLFEVCIV